MEAIALIDGNNFYASCEQSINPSLRKKALVILSNNDGCIIARSPEARCLKIEMGSPYFKIKKRLKELGVVVLSSNYSLYGDISRRLMNLLKKHCESIEIYSIDEAFVSISRPYDQDLHPWARNLRSLIYQNIGITITIGIAENKVRAKLANNLAKRINSSAGIFDMTTTNNPNDYLTKISVENIWGVGNQSTKWLKSNGIKNARELIDMEEYKIRNKLGIVGKRLQLELKGDKCLPIEVVQNSKKEIRVSRSFGKTITRLEELIEALATHTITASEKMRRQNLQTSKVTVFTRTSHYADLAYQKSSFRSLETATNNTNFLLKIIIKLAKEIYNPNYKLAKAGVLMQDLTSTKYIQKSIINESIESELMKQEELMHTIDRLNNRFKNGKITWAIAHKKHTWEMNRSFLSNTSTTDIKKIPIIII